MLIRFTVSNFMSFKDEVEFSMVAGRPRMHPEHVYRVPNRRDLRLLKTGVIYGANASGKTNLIKAMDFAQTLITDGTQVKQPIAAVPYLLDKRTESQTSKFLFEILLDGKAYAYAFEVDSTRVHSESLYEIRPASIKLLFERTSAENGETHVAFGKLEFNEIHDKAFLQHTAQGTRHNQLYLTESVLRNVSYFDEVYDWFQNRLVLIFTHTTPGPELGAIYLNDEWSFQSKYHDLIGLYDLDISGIELQPLGIDVKQLFSDEDQAQISRLMPDASDEAEFKTLLYNPVSQLFITVDRYQRYEGYKFVTVHPVSHEDREVYFDLSQESDGTVRLFELTPALIRLLSSKREIVFVVDELDRSLHSQMSWNILDIFLVNGVDKPSQLIVTTHDTSLLDLYKLRRDELWFVEKSRIGGSELYSLEEYAPRHNAEIQRGYMFGRYGAIPIIPSYNELNWANSDE